MSTDEAGDFLQDLLTRAGTGADANMSIGTHSCKATLLTWTTWSPIVTFSPKEQRHLGHHLKRGQSTLAYSREYFVTLCGKVLGMYRTIRSGRFNPDESPSQRAVAIADGYDREASGEISPDLQAVFGGGPGSAADRRLNDTEPFGDSDDGSASAESCVEKPDGARKPPSGGRLPFEAEDDRELRFAWVHVQRRVAEDVNLIFRGSSESLKYHVHVVDQFTTCDVSGCTKFGLAPELLRKMIEAGFDTFGKVAFAAGANPVTLTDSAVDEWISTFEDPLPSPFQISVIRRIVYESQNVSIADLKARVEPSTEVQVRKLPMAERLVRQEEQAKRLTGLQLTPHNLPGHARVDEVVSMIENNTLKYLPMNRWISRSQELALRKNDPAVSLDNEGNIKISGKTPDLTCDTSGLYALRQAFQRRALAFDLASSHIW
ncbi:unnamed protein product, partial [Symbiodinium necroappetens]